MGAGGKGFQGSNPPHAQQSEAKKCFRTCDHPELTNLVQRVQ